MGFCQKVVAAVDALETEKKLILSYSDFRQQVEAKYNIMEVIKDWTKKLLGGLIATIIFTNSAFGMTLKNPKDVANELENSVKKGGFSVQVVEDKHDTQKWGGFDQPVQKVKFTLTKDGKPCGSVNYTSWDTDKDDSGDMNPQAEGSGVSLTMADHVQGQDAKDAHIALLTLKLSLEQKGGMSDGSDTKDILKKVMEHKASDYGNDGYEPLTKPIKKLVNLEKEKHNQKTVEKVKDTKKVADNTKVKDTKKTGDGKKVSDNTKKTGKDLSKTAKNIGKNISKTADDFKKEVKQAGKGVKQVWDDSTSYIKKLANK